jgi:hypothetical protein
VKSLKRGGDERDAFMEAASRAGPNLANVSDGTVEGKIAALQRQHEEDIKALKSSVDKQGQMIDGINQKMQTHDQEFKHARNYVDQTRDEIYKRIEDTRVNLVAAIDNQVELKVQVSLIDLQAKFDTLEQSVQDNRNHVTGTLDNYQTTMRYLEEIVRPDDGKKIREEFQLLYSAVATLADNNPGEGPKSSVERLETVVANMQIVVTKHQSDVNALKLGLQIDKGIFHDVAFDRHVEFVNGFEQRVGG